MMLKQITQLPPDSVLLTWDDGHRGPVRRVTLRDACPCAGCKGETILNEHYAPPPVDRSVPGRYDLAGASVVGNYAMQFRWKDGHGEGMYTWAYLRSLCECDECVSQKREQGGDVPPDEP